MTWLDFKTLEMIAILAAGWTGGYWTMRWKHGLSQKAIADREKEILRATQCQAEAILREARLAGIEEAAKLREQVERSFDLRRQELTGAEQRLTQKESAISAQLEGLVEKEKHL